MMTDKEMANAEKNKKVFEETKSAIWTLLDNMPVWMAKDIIKSIDQAIDYKAVIKVTT